MTDIFTPEIKLGMIAGGQLAKMLIQEASKLDISTYILDQDENCPASEIASHYVKGSNLNYEDVYQFGKKVDLLTYEMENINIDALKQLKKEGLRIVPDPDTLALIQDKGLQKDFYSDNNIHTSPYSLLKDKKEILESIHKGKITYPFVQKLRTGGYDGRGVSVISEVSDLPKLLDGPSLIEEKVNIKKEIAVIAARNGKGQIKCYPVVEMVFDPEANLVDKLICPSNISDKQTLTATNMASQIIEKLDMEGILAVEFFIDYNDNVIVNEVAPRPHNSGHHTIESIITSQYEQHIRSILNLPLGSTEMKRPAVMVNLLGEEGFEGPTKYEGLSESLAIEGVKIHLYGKKVTKPFRKMGHVTILGETIDIALKNAEKVKELIKVKA